MRERPKCDFDMEFPDYGSLDYRMVCSVCGDVLPSMELAAYRMRTGCPEERRRIRKEEGFFGWLMRMLS